jgi:cytochrome b6-f complex subunit 7
MGIAKRNWEAVEGEFWVGVVKFKADSFFLGLFCDNTLRSRQLFCKGESIFMAEEIFNAALLSFILVPVGLIVGFLLLKVEGNEEV